MVSDNAAVVRWGVLGSAWITNAAIPGILAAPSARLEAVSSRGLDRAVAARERWGAAKAYGSYDELLADADIDAVYVPLPNQLHAEWAIKALAAGKHVLCEKPLALGVEQVEAIAQAAKTAGRFVTEAFMYRYAPRWGRFLDVVGDGTIGAPRVARLAMGFKQHYDSYNIRFDPAAGGGAVWDVGCYVVNKARAIFGTEPVLVFARAWTRPGESVDTTTDIVLDFGDGRSAMCCVSLDYVNPFSQDEVIGTDGWVNLPGTGMRMEPFSRLQWYRFEDEMFVDGAEPTMETFPRSDDFALEVESFSQAVLTGVSPEFGIDDALANARVLDAVHQSIRTSQPVELSEGKSHDQH